MLIKSRQRGVTLVELMVAVVIVALLLALAMPNYSTWIQNQQTRVAAESILNGIQLARNEAVKNNGKARFVLCAPPDSSWEVLAVSATVPSAALACGAAGAGIVSVQTRSGQEGSRLSQVAVTPAGEFAVTFNSFGRVVAGDAIAAPITDIDVANPLGGDRPLKITLGVGGNIRMCDPLLPALTDPRRC